MVYLFSLTTANLLIMAAIVMKLFNPSGALPVLPFWSIDAPWTPDADRPLSTLNAYSNNKLTWTATSISTYERFLYKFPEAFDTDEGEDDVVYYDDPLFPREI
ncbi:hypothetical protein DFH28DRAFT_965960 [Melampsora americana]|nr:hypothetical protein DFH28DRAFT_967438 [Melampsora americana]KAH9816052.1 hypothetical protein DFH28DRAFT_965960 [Melampsora americana]